MDSPRGWTERLRRLVRAASTGRDDRHGVLADPPSSPPPELSSAAEREQVALPAPTAVNGFGLPPAVLTIAAWSLALLVIGALTARGALIAVPLVACANAVRNHLTEGDGVARPGGGGTAARGRGGRARRSTGPVGGRDMA